MAGTEIGDRLQVEQSLLSTVVQVMDQMHRTEQRILARGFFKNVSVTEMHTLQAIGPYEKPTMSETAAALQITVGTLTVAVDRLVRKGYIKRLRDRDDRRVVRIHLTKKGKLACRLFSRYQKDLLHDVLRQHESSEIIALTQMLTDILQHLNGKYEAYGRKDYQAFDAERGEQHEEQPVE